jgi:hypothetical protein
MLVEVHESGLKELESMLSGIKNGAVKALVNGINQTVKTMSVQIKARIANDVNLTAARIGQDIRTGTANYQEPSSYVKVIGKPVGLINFGAKATKKGVSVKVKKRGSSFIVSNAFIAKGNVWRRAIQGGKRVGRLPIERMTGPRVADIFAKPEIYETMQIQSAKLLQDNIDKQAEDILRRSRL